MDIGAAKTCIHSGPTFSHYRILLPSSSSSCSSSIIQCASCSNAERACPVSKKEPTAAVGGGRQQRRGEQEKKNPMKAIAHQGSPQPPSSAKGAEAKQRSQEHYDCVVVGAGISGLATAQALATRHSTQVTRVLVTEAQSCVGGNIATVERDGYLWEEGPNSFQPSDPILTLVMDCGLKDELLLGDPKAPRFVLWEGRLRPVPSGPADLPFFDLLSVPGKLRAGLGALGIRPPPPGREESVEDFVRRNLGDEVFERLIEPFCSGVYAGDASKLSMKAAFGRVWRLEELGGSILGGTFKLIQDKRMNLPPPRDPRLPKPDSQTVGSFRKGLITLPNAIANKLGDRVKLNWKLVSIQKATNGNYDLTYTTPDGLKTISTKTVVLTMPSYVASEILRPLSKAAADALSKFYYPPVAAVTVSYPKTALRPERLVNGDLKGFGQLHPRSQGVQTLGTIYSSSLFPDRAPSDRVLLLNYIGGATNPDVASKGEGDLVRQVDKDLRKMLIRSDAPSPKVLGVKVWSKAIPQFVVGHLDILEDSLKALKGSGLGGIFLGGNYVVGVALGSCVQGAYESAETISKYFTKVGVNP